MGVDSFSEAPVSSTAHSVTVPLKYVKYVSLFIEIQALDEHVVELNGNSRHNISIQVESLFPPLGEYKSNLAFLLRCCGLHQLLEYKLLNTSKCSPAS